MPVKVTDDDLSAVVTTTAARVLSTKSTVTIVPGNPASINGVAIAAVGELWLKIRLQFHGVPVSNPTPDPTVISAEPVEDWSTDTRFSVYWNAGSGTNGRWTIQWSYTSFVPYPPKLLDIIGNIDAIDEIGISSGGIGNLYGYYSFSLYYHGLVVYPVEGEFCTIEIRKPIT